MPLSPSRARVDRRSVLLGALSLASVPVLARPALAFVRGEAEGMAAVAADGARLERLHGEGRWCEGPCWDRRRGGLVFSDVRRNQLMFLPGGRGPAVALRDPSDNTNGNILDRDDRLVSCRHRTRSVVREEADGTLTTIADGYGGRRLNSPNDAALAPDGAIWFTDPVFGIRQPDEGLMAEPEQPARRVYRIDPSSGAVEARVETMDQPNGIAFSPDGATLYVAEAGAGPNPEGAGGIRAFAVRDDGTLGAQRDFTPPDGGLVDGLAVDREGRVYAATGAGVAVHDPDGRRLGLIATPTPCANMAFGGKNGRRLFVTAGHEVFGIDLRVAGASFS